MIILDINMRSWDTGNSDSNSQYTTDDIIQMLEILVDFLAL